MPRIEPKAFTSKSIADTARENWWERSASNNNSTISSSIEFALDESIL